MSAPDPIQRELIAFAGELQCEQSAGAVNLVLRGHARANQRALAGRCEVLFSGATDATEATDATDATGASDAGDAGAAALPATMRDLRIVELPAVLSALRRFRLEAPQLQRELQARSVQLHHDAVAPFYRALPPPRLPLRLRLGWTVLLSLLRIPGAAAVLRTLRGAS